VDTEGLTPILDVLNDGDTGSAAARSEGKKEEA
jgi:hypothetical protein